MKILKTTLFCAAILSAQFTTHAQETVNLEGYVYEVNNRGYIKNVKVTILKKNSDDVVGETKTNKDGIFNIDLPRGKEFRIIVEKKLFIKKEESVSTFGKKAGDKVFSKIIMERKPGYIFDVTIAEPKRNGESVVNAIDSARIEVYNNTSSKEELVLLNWPHPTFKFTFEPGNHYTIMIRHGGYFNKRIEAYVNVEGCILCFDGLGTVEPGVVDIMSHGLKMGTFLANIELEPLKLNQTYKLNNIYYDYDKWAIRPDAQVELDNLVSILKDNPAVIVELGSHTDSRGRDFYNLELSEKRAKAAVDYIVSTSVINQENIVSKGYGETQFVNACKNGVVCSEQKHQENRRTELKVLGISEIDPLENKSLKQIIEEEKVIEEIMETDPLDVKPVEEQEVLLDTNHK